jgi:serine/threonine protein phosphatase PrpC
VIVLGDDVEETLVACVADGAGSAKHSAIGSAKACESIVQSATAHFDRHHSLAGLQREDVLQWCDDVRALLSEDAAARGVDVRELATTLCAAVVSNTYAAFFQIGDGAIILRRLGICGVVFWPQSGEYANTTNFLTSNEYRDHLQFFSTTTGFSDVALLTDGIERLALRFDSRTPHPPFFEPLFQALRTDDDSRNLAEGLRRFLQSDSVRSRSDDDKTLILASSIGRDRNYAD